MVGSHNTVTTKSLARHHICNTTLHKTNTSIIIALLTPTLSHTAYIVSRLPDILDRCNLTIYKRYILVELQDILYKSPLDITAINQPYKLVLILHNPVILTIPTQRSLENGDGILLLTAKLEALSSALLVATKLGSTNNRKLNSSKHYACGDAHRGIIFKILFKALANLSHKLEHLLPLAHNK